MPTSEAASAWGWITDPPPGHASALPTTWPGLRGRRRGVSASAALPGARAGVGAASLASGGVERRCVWLAATSWASSPELRMAETTLRSCGMERASSSCRISGWRLVILQGREVGMMQGRSGALQQVDEGQPVS